MPSNNKVLVIACGGTGTRMARKLVEKFGRLPSHVAMVVVDAHTGRPEGGRIEGAFFSGSEGIYYPQEWSDLNAKPASGLSDWWPSRVQPEKEVRFEEGCGAVRANGRFYMLRHGEFVLRAIDRAIEEKISAARIGVDGQGGDPFNWEVYVLASLGNGTGGGTFMDVATMVKHRLAEHGFIQPKVVGVFVPGSVTRQGSGSVDRDWMENQVAASGFAALVELQYEFNRQNSADDWRPLKPHSFKAFTGGTYREFFAAQGIRIQADANREPPYDFALVLDSVNKRAVRNEYEDLMDAGAEALKMLMTGANEANRILDLERKCKEGRRFGSVGSMALEAPTHDLVQYAACRATLGAFDVGSREDLDPLHWDDLLADATPGGHQRYPAAGAKVEGSVDFFVQHVLRVKEQVGGDGARINQLFDRFAAEDDELRRTFSLARGGEEGLQVTPAGQVIGKVRSLRDWIILQAEDLRKRRTSDLVSDKRSLWARQPVAGSYQDLERLDEAGLRWLLEQRVARFVDRGAFGPLVTWLEELKRQLRNNVDSVRAHEVKTHLGSDAALESGDAGIDLDGLIKELDDATGSIFAFFLRTRIDQIKDDLDVALRGRLEFDLWHSKIEAVLALYQALIQHVDVLVAGARRAATELRSSGVRQGLERQADMIATRLSNRRKGAKVAYIGCDTQVRGDLVAQLDKDDATDRYGLLGLVPPLMWRLYSYALGRDRAGVGLVAARLGAHAEDVPRLDKLQAELSSETLEAVEQRIGPVVAHLANVDELLVREARTALSAYVDEYYLPVVRGTGLAGAAARQALDDLVSVVGDDINRIDEILARQPNIGQALYEERRDGKVDGAVMVYVRGRVRNLIAAALPLWRPTMPTDMRALIQETAFFNHSSHARHVSQALAELKGGDRSRGLDVAPQASPFFPPSRIECVFVALGGSLGWLARESEVHSYRLAMDGMPELPKDDPYRTWFAGFNPHTAREYEEAGLKWLDRWDRSQAEVSALGDLAGDLVLALASLEVATYPQLFRWLSRSGAHVYLGRQIGQRYDNNRRPIFEDAAVGYAKGTKVGPKGIGYFTDWLEGYDRGGFSGADGRALAAALKHLLWDDLQTWIEGDASSTPVVPGAGLETVVRELGVKASALRSEGADGTTGRAEVDTRVSMGEALQRLADELMRTSGARPAFLQA